MIVRAKRLAFLVGVFVFLGGGSIGVSQAPWSRSREEVKQLEVQAAWAKVSALPMTAWEQLPRKKANP